MAYSLYFWRSYALTLQIAFAACFRVLRAEVICIGSILKNRLFCVFVTLSLVCVFLKYKSIRDNVLYCHKPIKILHKIPVFKFAFG